MFANQNPFANGEQSKKSYLIFEQDLNNQAHGTSQRGIPDANNSTINKSLNLSKSQSELKKEKMDSMVPQSNDGKRQRSSRRGGPSGEDVL